MLLANMGGGGCVVHVYVYRHHCCRGLHKVLLLANDDWHLELERKTGPVLTPGAHTWTWVWLTGEAGTGSTKQPANHNKRK